jgi:hypothetical protein
MEKAWTFPTARPRASRSADSERRSPTRKASKNGSGSSGSRVSLVIGGVLSSRPQLSFYLATSLAKSGTK